MEENLMAEDNWLEIQHKSLDEIEMIGCMLEKISGDFYAVGNPKMGDKLHVYSTSLERVTEKMRKANSDHTHLLVKQAHQSTGTMLNAMLVGMEISEASGNPEKMENLRKKVHENMEKYS